MDKTLNKIILMVIALVLAIYNLGTSNTIVGIYWVFVFIYWLTNFMGDRDE